MDKKKLIIFDFDGVLFNSLKNMEIAWKNVNLKFGLKIEFQEYIKNLGFHFQVILKNLGINSNRTQIQKYYNLISTYNIDKIQPYKNTLKTINKLKLKNIKIAICTSKDKIRTNFVIKKYNLEFDAIETISTNIKGKPNPDQILRIIKTNIRRTGFIDLMVTSTISQNDQLRNMFKHVINVRYRKDNP